jgi:hypothetical protein
MSGPRIAIATDAHFISFSGEMMQLFSAANDPTIFHIMQLFSI